MVTRPELSVRPFATVRAQLPFHRYLEERVPEINGRIMEVLHRYGPEQGMAHELLNLLSHGKRMRAGMAVLTHDAFAHDGSGRDTILDLAAAIEIAHACSLILDDMIDGDDRRRGRPALHMSNGHKNALLAMVGVLSIPYSLASLHGGNYTELMAKTHRAMVAGELAEVGMRREESSKGSYENIISMKTGRLFSLATTCGAMAARCPLAQIEALSRHGLLAGMAVQLADDISDIGTSSLDERPGGGSERILTWIIAPSSVTSARTATSMSGGGPRDAVMNDMVKDLLSRADEALCSALANGTGISSGRDDLSGCLRSAPGEMVAMMLSERKEDGPSCARDLFGPLPKRLK